MFSVAWSVVLILSGAGWARITAVKGPNNRHLKRECCGVFFFFVLWERASRTLRVGFFLFLNFCLRLHNMLWEQPLTRYKSAFFSFSLLVLITQFCVHRAGTPSSSNTLTLVPTLTSRSSSLLPPPPLPCPRGYRLFCFVDLFPVWEQRVERLDARVEAGGEADACARADRRERALPTHGEAHQRAHSGAQALRPAHLPRRTPLPEEAAG